jgi:hypothetical protein
MNGSYLNGNVVIVPHPAKIVELQVTSQGGGFRLDTLLEASISGHGIDIEIEHVKARPIVGGTQPLAGNSHTHGSGKTISKRSSGGLDTGGPVVFGVTGATRMELTEGFEVVDGDGLAVAD